MVNPAQIGVADYKVSPIYILALPAYSPAIAAFSYKKYIFSVRSFFSFSFKESWMAFYISSSSSLATIPPIYLYACWADSFNAAYIC